MTPRVTLAKISQSSVLIARSVRLPKKLVLRRLTCKGLPLQPSRAVAAVPAVLAWVARHRHARALHLPKAKWLGRTFHLLKATPVRRVRRVPHPLEVTLVHRVRVRRVPHPLKAMPTCRVPPL